MKQVPNPLLLGREIFIKIWTGCGVPEPPHLYYSTCWIADNCQDLFPTGRVNVQYSSNLTGSVLLPDAT